MAVPYTFATQTTSIPLAQLDTNFSTPVTIGTTTIPLGNIAPILENVTLGNVVIASGNVTLTNVNVINATITQATITTANVTTANITSAFITTANVTTANITTANVVTIRATTANIATANVTAMEAVAANVTTLRSTNINVTTANATTAYITTANVATANVTAMEAVSANVTTIRSTTANLTTANVTTLIASVINVATANVTTIITADITDSGNLTFTGTGNRITGDFTNATQVNKVAFQTATANSATVIAALPSGTGTNSQWRAYNSNDPTNSSWCGILGTASSNQIQSSITGTGTYLPMTFSTGGSERARIDTSGNVGINNTNPADTLDVVGNIRISSASLLRWVDAGTVRSSIQGDASSNLIISTASTERMRIDSSGNVGIGTASPASRLDVKSTAAGTADMRLSFSASDYMGLSSESDGYQLAAVGGTNALRFAAGGSQRMRIDSSGNVGIGTATPGSMFSEATQLVVGSGTGGQGITVYAGTSSVSRLHFADGTTGNQQYRGYVVYYHTSDYLSFGTAAGDRVRIDSVGNTYIDTGNLWQYSPAPTALAAGANAGTAAQLRSGMFSAAQTTAVTLTMPTGTAIDTGFAGALSVDIGFYFYVINTGSSLGAVTVAVNTNVTSLGSLVVAIGTSAQFRLRRTAANTYIMYRLS